MYLYRMWFGVLAKLIYTFILWRWVLPSFKKSKPIYVFLSIAGLFAIFLIIEIVLSWQFRVFTVSHMVNHSSPAIWLTLVTYLLITLISITIYFTRESFKNERQKRELIESQLSTELKYLKTQVNPHFLFNTLNNLFSIAQKNKDEETANGISKLAGLMRYMLYDSTVTNVPLEKEIKNITDFITLAKLRYSRGEVIVNISEKGELSRALIAPMILLPFIENAFKHGVDIEKTTVISIIIEAAVNKIIFQCTNPVAEPSSLAFTEYSGIGLENVKRRLALLYPEKHKLVITNNDKNFSVYLELAT